MVLGIGWGAVFVGILSRLPCQFTDQPTNTCNVHDRCGGVALARPMVLYADPSEPLEGGTRAFAALKSGCIGVLTMNGSTWFAELREQLKVLGMWRRTVIFQNKREACGSATGLFRAHKTAWAHGVRRGCRHMLVMEDDAHFHRATLNVSEPRVGAFLRAAGDDDADILFLGFHIPGQPRQPTERLHCIYRIHAPSLAHAYIISANAMRRLGQWPAQGHVDHFLAYSQAATYAVRPQFAFQRYHQTTNPWYGSNNASLLLQHSQARWLSSPARVHEWEETNLYSHAGQNESSSCSGVEG